MVRSGELRAIRKSGAGKENFRAGRSERANVPEVTGSFLGGRNRLVEILGRAFETRFFGEEKERFIFLGIVMPRDEKGPAEGSSEIVPAIQRSLRGLVEKVARVEELVAVEFVEVAVILLPAGFGGDENRPGGAASILRAVIRGQHLYFLNGVQTGIDDERALVSIDARV